MVFDVGVVLGADRQLSHGGRLIIAGTEGRVGFEGCDIDPKFGQCLRDEVKASWDWLLGKDSEVYIEVNELLREVSLKYLPVDEKLTLPVMVNI